MLKKMRKKAGAFLVMICLGVVILLCWEAGEHLKDKILRSLETAAEARTGKQTVVLDSGHGGSDSGKVGINGAKEKEINLLIAKEIRRLLEKEKIEVIMVREKDEELGKSKVEDLKYRVSLMNEKKPSLAVSIHQNSYHEENVFGAQVFYYKTSTEGKKAAAVIQEALQEVNPENTKKIKANDTYYLLKKTEVPTVIVECGFLSNYAEAEKLVSEDYQKKVAEAVTKGILQYLKDQ